MNAPFQINGPITQQRAEQATEWLVHHAKDIALARAEKERAENRLRVVKSLAMKVSGEKSVAAQEREAYCSQQYQDQVDEVFAATVKHEELIATRIAAECVIEVWRSLNSNLKGARV